jgi:60 kDa SS-A/Ro ribonucleoprotein
LEEQFIQTLLTNTFGQTFYVSQRDVIQQADALHTQVLETDPEYMAKALVYARNKGYMRSQPVYGLAKMVSYKGSKEQVDKRRRLAVGVFDSVIRTPNDLYDFVTVCNSMGNNLSGRSLKRMINRWLDTKVSEYWAIKYGSEGRKGDWNLSKILRHFHPRHKELFRYLRSRKNADFTVDLNKLPQVRAFEQLKKATSDSEKVRLITEGRLPHEVASSFAGSSKEVWRAIVPQLPIFALLRNLATLERHGVLDEFRGHIEEKLTNPKVIHNSKILPFRFDKAAEKVTTNWAVDALRGALEVSVENIPQIPGRVAVMLDISGSMGGGYYGNRSMYIDTASILALALMKKANLNGRLLLFDTQTEEFPVSQYDSILSQSRKIRPRGGTDTGSPVRVITKDRDEIDTIIMITDEQQNTGSPFCDELSRYRGSVNRNVRSFIINVSPYKGRMVDESDKLVHYIYGWSDQVLTYISMASQGWKGMADAIRNDAL